MTPKKKSPGVKAGHESYHAREGGLSERNNVLLKEHDNQGLESLILSMDCSKESTFYIGNMTTRVQNP